MQIADGDDFRLPEHDIHALASMSLQKLSDEGHRVEATSSVKIYEKRMMEAGALENHLVMSPREHDFATNDALGLMLVDAKGRVVAGIAARFIDLGSDTLADHMQESYCRLYGQGVTSAVKSRLSAARKITGKIVYQGQWYMVPEVRGGKVHTPAMFHYFHSLCFTKWRPDFAYGFFPIALAERAFSYGYPHAFLQANSWQIKNDRRGDKECLVYSSFQEFVERSTSIATSPDMFPRRIKTESSS